MAAKKKVTSVDPVEESEVVVLALAYGSLTTQAKKLSEEAEVIKQRLKGYVDDNGILTTKGHLIVEKTHAGNHITLMQESRVSSKLKPDAIDLIRGTRFGKSLIETYEGVNLDKVEDLHKKGKLTDDFMASIFDTGTTYAFKLKVTKESDE